MQFAIILGALLGLGLLTVAHLTHHRFCVAHGRTPQPIPYALYAVMIGLLCAALALPHIG